MAWNAFLLIATSLLFTREVVSEVTIEGAPEKFAVVGNELRLTCRYSFDVSEVQWLKNDIVISSNDTMENNTRGNITHFNESSIQLTISPIISSDAANYTCVVFDFVDNSSDTIAIRVKPDPPQNVAIESKTSRTITVSWKPGFNGNSEIISYTVRISENDFNYRDANCQGWSNSSCTVSGLDTNATLEGLRPFTTYFLRVYADNEVGQSNTSYVVNTVTDQEEPSAAPVSLQGHNKSSTSIFVTWGQVPTSDQNGVILNYTVSYKEATSGSVQRVTVDEPTNSTTLKGLNEYTNYSITVFASTIKGPGIVSAPIFVITDEDKPNAPPADVTGRSVNSTSILVSWREVPFPDQNGVILSYTVSYRNLSSSSAQTKKVTTPANQITLTDLNEYTNYSITVFASTLKGDGNKSTPIVVITDEDKPSAAPVSLQGHNKSSTSIFVTWGQVPTSDQNGVILNYTVSYKEATSGSVQRVTVDEPTNSTTLKGLNEYTNYSITVFASTIKGPGIVSAPIFVITDEDKPNAPPADVTGRSVNSTSILVSWREVPFPDQNGVILSYTVSYRNLSSSSAQTKKVTTPANQITLTDLNEYTNYSITVFASTLKGDGNKSTPIVVITDEDKPSAAPVSLQGHNKSSTSIFVTWGQVPTSDQNGVILNYTVSYKEATSGSVQRVTVDEPTNSTTLKGLNEYTNYSITVFASTIKGPGIVSAPIFVITDEDKPNAPPADVTGRSVNSTSILVSWREVPFPDQNGVILSYTVSYRNLSSSSAQTKKVTTPANQITLTDLNEYTNYSITVFASTLKGDGNKSTPIVVITDEDKPSAAPVSLQGHNKSSTSIFVTWGQVPTSDQNGVILNYTVSYKEATSGSVQRVTVDEPTNSTTLKGLNEYTNYSITVFASTIKGPGIVSAPIFVITDEDKPNAPPADVTGRSVNSTSILVSWREVPFPDQNGVILSYTVSYRNLSSSSAQTKKVTTPANQITLTDLNEYTNYSITVFASTLKGDGNKSTPIVVITDEDKPSAAPVSLQGHNKSSTSIFVTWGQVPTSDQNGVILNYTVSYKEATSGSVQRVTVDEPTNSTTLKGLNEYTNYSITVFASTIKGPGIVSAPIFVITDEDKPNAPPADVTGRSVNSTSILVSWREVPFPDQNGVILSYTVSYRNLSSSSAQTKKVTTPANQITLTDLNEYTNYSITVFASTLKGDGNKSTPIVVITDEDKPSAAPVSLQGHNKSSTSIFVTWGQVPTSDQNGVILNYTVSYKEATSGSVQRVTVDEPTNSTTLKGLNEYTNYSITVFASTIKGPGIVSAPIFVITDEDKPNAPPADVTGRSVNSTSILVSWREVPFPDQNGVILSYTVSYRNLSSSSAQTKKVTTPANQITLTDLNEYTNYSITVFASTLKGDGNKSTPIVVITDEDKPSAAPVSLQGHNKSSTSIFVTWGQVPTSDQNGVILNYTVSYKEATSGSVQRVTVDEPTNSTTLKGLNEYTNYSITVFASTIKGPGIVSAPIFVITDEDKPNAPPADVTGRSVNSTSILVSWREVPFPDQNGVILSYTVSYRNLSSSSAQTKKVTTPANQITLTDLNEYTNYSITVFASTLKGDGNKSTPIVVITDEDKPSAAPVSLQGHNKSSTSIFVTWGQVPTSDQNGVILNYTVSYKEATSGSVQRVTVDEPTNSTTLKGLNEYTNYSITVFASTIKGPGIVSAPIFVITDEDKPNAPPADVTGRSVNSTSILVSWREVPFPDQNGVILSYTVSYRNLSSSSAQTKKVTTPANQITLTDLNEYTNYSITVFASTLKGDGNKSTPIVVITDEDKPSAAPVSLQGHNKSSTSIFVTWGQVPTSDQNGVILNYTVSYKEATSGSVQRVTVDEPTNSTTLKGLNEYTNYSITVFASTIKGPGIVSAPIFVITDEDKPNAPPADVTGRSVNSTSILVSWREVPFPDQNGVILSYTVSYRNLSSSSAQTKKVTTPANQITLTDLNEYTNYSITVFASTLKGDGNKSTPIVVITDEDKPSAAPVSLQGHNKSSTSIFVTWGQVPTSDQNGVILNYTVSYKEATSGSVQRVTVDEPTNSTTLKGLNEYTNYSITVFASTIKGPGIVSAPIFVITDEDKPNAPPADVTGRSVNSTSILVSWREVPFPDQNGVILSYTVSYRNLSSSSAQTKKVTTPANQITLTDLNEYTNYSITVFASTLKGDGNKSTPIVVITDEDKPSAAPVSLQGHNKSSTSIFVTWGQVPTSDQNGVILNYTVSYKEATSGSVQRVTVDEPTNSTTLKGLNEYTNYSITVFASTIKGPGIVSAPIFVITDEDKPNAPPADVTGRSVNSTSILVSWREVPFPDQNGVILSYTVSYRNLSSSSAQTKKVTTPANQITLTDLNEYTNYSITVFASTLKGDGNKSTPIVVITDEDKPSAAPVSLQGHNKSSTSIFVTWGQVPTSDQNGVILNYTVSYKEATSGSVQRVTVDEPTNSTTLKGLNEYTNYSITVFASTIKGPGIVSAPIFVITDEDKPNAPPADVTGRSVNSTSILVSWREVPFPDQNGVILSYTVSYRNLSSSSAQTKKVTTPANQITLTDLNEYTNYSITVFASTLKGDGNKSTPIVVITDEDKPSAAPVSLQGHNKSSTSIFVTWGQVPTSDQNGVILNYTVSYKEATSGSVQRVTVDEPTNSTTLKGLNEYTNYSITVFASTIKGPGVVSAPIFVITDEDKPNAPPADVTGRSVNSTSILVSWGEVPFPDQNGVILSYTVTYRNLSSSSAQTKKVTTPANQITLTDLSEYTNYNIRVFASTLKGDGNKSTPIFIVTDEYTPSAAPVSLQGHNKSSTSIFVTWGQVPFSDQNGVILNYTVSYKEASNGSAQRVTVDEPANSTTLKGLNEYTNYIITVFASTIKGPGIVSAPIFVITDEDKPKAPPASVNGHNASSTSISVQWDEVPAQDQNGVIVGHTVTFIALPSGTKQTKNVTAPASQTTLTGLNEFTNYSITVFASTSKGSGNASLPIIVITDEDKPSESPKISKVKALNSTSILVNWLRVNETSRNGIITRYTIHYEDVAKEDNRTVDILAPATETVITGLRQKAMYLFQILAATSKGDGPYSVSVKEQTKVVPSEPPVPTEQIGTTEVIIPFKNKEELSSGEPVSYFQVIVMPVKEGQDPGNSADSRYETVTRTYKNIVEGEPYITAEFSKKDAKATFPVGDGKVYSRNGVKDSKRKRRNVNKPVTVIEYLNGELDDNTQYAVFQRSFAENGNYENEGFIKFETKKDYTIVGYLVPVLVLVVVFIVLAIFIYRRRRRQNENLDGRIPMQKKQRRPTVSRIGDRGIDNPNFIPGGIIPVDEFEDHVRRLHANDDILLSQEYAALRPASDTTSNATLAQENRHKNRYNNIVAYDHSRVKLDPISNVPGSDYINANYLNGYNKEKAYIATQGPLPETAADFWRMVWEQNSKIIVMVTNLEERGRVKCFQYWPSEGYENHGDIQVQLTEIIELSDFTIRKFCLRKSNSRVERMVSQYHYTTWPDHGVPSRPTSLLGFVKKASAANPTDAGPMVVHCSAGVGRTGTFITVDAMLQRIAVEKTVDVFGYVMSLRRDRNIMVQVEQQYVFIHEALLEAIHSGYTEVQAMDLRAHIKNLTQVNQNTGQTEMDEEFNRLARVNTAPPSQFKAANMPYNKTKNRYANVLAFDDSRVKLSVLSGIEGSDYINASFIDGYVTRRAFIATQAPIPDTIPDFWRMIWEQESYTVVMLSGETEKGKTKVHRYWPGKHPANIGNLVVEMTNEASFEDYIMREIKITNTQESASRVVRQYQYTGWPEDGSPDTGTGLIDLIGQVQGWQQRSGNSTIVVHCSAGVGRTGVFCALSILIERLKSEGVVDVFQTIKLLRSQRPAMVQTKDQYEFLYRVLKEYLDSFDAYSNFEADQY